MLLNKNRQSNRCSLHLLYFSIKPNRQSNRCSLQLRRIEVLLNKIQLKYKKWINKNFPTFLLKNKVNESLYTADKCNRFFINIFASYHAAYNINVFWRFFQFFLVNVIIIILPISSNQHFIYMNWMNATNYL